jgi:hypothetical protein
MHIKGSKWGISDEQAQGVLLTKTMMQYKQAGVQRSYMFMAADEPGSNGGLWQTCGIMRNKESGYAPKASYDAVRSLLKQMKLEVKQNQLQ